MLKIVKDRRAWWPVTYFAAAEDGHAIVENRFEMRFRLPDVDQLGTIRERAAALDAARAEKPEAHGSLARAHADLLQDIVEDWRSVCAENGEALPFNPDNLALLLGLPGMFQNILEGWNRCMLGLPETRTGN